MAGVPPKKGAAFTFTVALTSQADTKIFKVNPTIAEGDFTVSKDQGAYANLSTLPDAEPDSSSSVRIQLSSSEMNANEVRVLCHDASGAEWCDQMIVIHTDTATIGEIEAQTDDIGEAGAGLTAIPWNADWDAEIESEVDDALGGGTGTALTAIPWNADWDAEVQSEAADALNAYDPPTNAEMEARTLPAASYFDPAADTVANVTTVASTTTVGATGLAAIAAEVWDYLTSALTTVGSIGKWLIDHIGTGWGGGF